MAPQVATDGRDAFPGLGAFLCMQENTFKENLCGAFDIQNDCGKRYSRVEFNEPEENFLLQGEYDEIQKEFQSFINDQGSVTSALLRYGLPSEENADEEEESDDEVDDKENIIDPADNIEVHPYYDDAKRRSFVHSYMDISEVMCLKEEGKFKDTDIDSNERNKRRRKKNVSDKRNGNPHTRRGIRFYRAMNPVVFEVPDRASYSPEEKAAIWWQMDDIRQMRSKRNQITKKYQEILDSGRMDKIQRLNLRGCEKYTKQGFFEFKNRVAQFRCDNYNADGDPDASLHWKEMTDEDRVAFFQKCNEESILIAYNAGLSDAAHCPARLEHEASLGEC